MSELDADERDRWLHPRSQTEYPAREVISEVVMHGRREATFLVLAAMFLVAGVAVVVLAEPVIDVSGLIERLAPSVSVPATLWLPLGVAPSALGVAAILLACELYGPRRAGALVWVAVFASAALVGLARLAELVDPQLDRFAASLALAASWLVSQLVGVVLFAVLRNKLRQRWLLLRAISAAALGQVAGWAAFAGITRALSASPDLHAVNAIAGGAAACVVACMFVLAIPLAIAKRSLSLYLRVARRAPVDDDLEDDADERGDDYLEGPVLRRKLPAGSGTAVEQPESSAEMRFFSEGEEP